MNHPDEGRLRALLDGELPVDESRELQTHVSGCATCEVALRRVEETQSLATTLLDALDQPAPTERVRARLAEIRSRGGSGRARNAWWLRREDLAKAAILVLVFSGAVAAAVHPASPLRRLLEGNRSSPATASAPAPAPTTLAAPAREVGVRVSVAGAAGVRVALRGATPGQTVEVTWVDQGAAAVYAPEGTTFSTSDADGRIDAALANGPVRIELPRSAARASLTVNGRAFLEKSGERIDYSGPPALVEGQKVHFEVR